jgi:Ca-activated chloride channel family protein
VKSRIKEVTQLGLTYNLLTAYTSFVAIDTEVRLVNGQAVTVKQPLPLPEGVSDYAVGRGMAKQAMAPSNAPYIALRAQEYEQGSLKEEFKDKSMTSKPLQAFVELKEISTTSGLSKEAIQKVVKQQIPSIEICYQKALGKTSAVQGEVSFRLIINSKGRVIKLSLVSSKLNNKNLEQCIIQKVKGLNFPPPEGTDKVTAAISFDFKTS